MAGTNYFLVFNEANDPDQTMSDADYLADTYRVNGLIPMIADPVAHNKMYRQWSIMAAALGGVISDMNHDASDSDLATLQANLKVAIGEVGEAQVDTRITNLETWKGDITATPSELNILDGATLTTSELNILDGVTATASELNILAGTTVTATEFGYLSGVTSNIQQQIDGITGTLATPFPAWIKNTAYSVGDICICTGFDSYKYLECVEAGTSDTTAPANTAIGQMITDNSAKWLVCDWRDSAPVGTIRQDLARRDGWLKLNGATINTADYPRLVSFLSANSLIQAYTSTPVATDFTFGDANNDTVILPDLTNLFIENGAAALTVKAAGLPNVRGEAKLEVLISNYTANKNKVSLQSVSGAFKKSVNMNAGTYPFSNTLFNTSGTENSNGIGFDASLSNSIYGNSTTVQPPSVTLIPCIKY